MQGLASKWAHCALLLLAAQMADAKSPELQTGESAIRLHDLAARESQYRALSSLPDAIVEYDKQGRVKRVDGRTGIFLPRDAHVRPGEVGTWLFQRLKPILLATGKEDLKVSRVSSIAGERVVFFDQFISGIPVVDGGINVRTATDGEIREARSRFSPARRGIEKPRLSVEQARARIESFVRTVEPEESGAVTLAKHASLAYWTNNGSAEYPVLVWMIDATIGAGGESIEVRFAVDAASGELRQAKRLSFGLNRTVYSLGYRTDTDINGYPENLRLLWNEGAADPSDPHAMFAYQSVLDPIAAWSSSGLYPQLSYDWPNIVVHHGSTTHASWGGNRAEPYMIFGDRYAMDRDAIAHEYGHGLFFPWAPSPPSVYRWHEEWFAANEFFSDLSAVLTDIHRSGSTDWQVADVRNLANPASQISGDLRDWYPNRRFFGVGSSISYSNSTIFSHAVYLMINGGYHARAGQSADNFSGPIPFLYVNPIPATTVKLVFSDALVNLSFDYATVNGPNLKSATVASAQRLFGSTVAEEMDKAWRAVGIGFNCSGPPSVPANVSYINFQCKGKHRVMWTQVPGVKYHSEVRPVASGSSWDLGTTTTDGAMNNCMQNVPMTSVFRMRSCNACGCSDWTQEHQMQYYPVCL